MLNQFQPASTLPEIVRFYVTDRLGTPPRTG
jgi:hypothetical protein